ncbi:MAG: GtrA family protein [Deltaproteobacteria bacterium]|nr:GtrA family protein [Deltaproteobacteria bacterium]
MKQLSREMIRFIVSGCSAVATDMGSYYFLIRILSYSPAKAISFILGTIVAYLLGKYWTFEQPARSLGEVVRFLLLYLATLGVNVGVNELVLIFYPKIVAVTYLKMIPITYPKAVVVAFFMATGTSATLNFIGQKWWVFKR